MPSSSPTQYVLDTIVDALSTEPSFNVVRIWRSDASDPTRVTVYPYLGPVTYTTELEDYAQTGYSRAVVEILCSTLVESDPMGVGKTQEKTGLIAMLVKHALETYDYAALGSNQDQYYTTRIMGIVVDGHIGNFNVNDNRLQIGVAATAVFVTS